MKIEYNDPIPRLTPLSGETWLNGEDNVAKFIRDKFNAKMIFAIGAQKDFDFCKIFNGREIHLFEPNKFAFRELINNEEIINNPNIYLNMFGINNKEGYFTYYYRGESVYNHDGLDIKDTIFLTTLKKYMDSREIKKVDFLKVDIEGLEYEALKSAEEHLDNIEFVQFEYGERYPKAGKKLGDMYELFKGRYIYHVEQDTLRYAENPYEHFHYSNYIASKIKL